MEYKTVEVDAPSMIMVGEANKNGEYNYYVSRGEIVDPDGDGKADTLAVLQRTMKGDAPLTSAMNDVEWVDEESADSYTEGRKIDGTKYGYYVMCGDHGQVRRFWRNADVLTTDSNGNQIVEYGNYYWGGDYTYYTDYNLDRFSGENTYIYTTKADGTPSTDKVLSTDVSFKFIAMRPMQWESGTVPKDGLIATDDATDKSNKFRTGFNMSSKKYALIGSVGTTGIAHLRNLCTVSATYGSDVQFYGSDGKLFPYITSKTTVKNSSGDCDYIGPLTDTSKTPSYNDIVAWQSKSDENIATFENITVNGSQSQSLQWASNEAWGWLDPTSGTVNSYFKIYGKDTDTTINRDSYPITLTSVDAIRLSGSGAYESNVTDSSKTHYFSTGVLSGQETSGDATSGTNPNGKLTTQTNLTYPTSNYVLYCGYIPAYMDAWAGTSGKATYPFNYDNFNNYAKRSDGEGGIGFQTLATNIGRASNRQTLENNTSFYTLWRMTMGITPFYTGSELAWNKEANKAQVAYSTTYKISNGIKSGDDYGNTIVYYPYTNLEYAITGKFYDSNTYNTTDLSALFPTTKSRSSVGLADSSLLISNINANQQYATAGKVIDITVSYLSHPLAISIAANPTDHIVYDLATNKNDRQIFYWHNRRESITFLDSASTVVPNGDKDVPVSLMVGYVLGGTVAYGKEGGSANVDVTSVMNNGIVFIRAGNSEIAPQGNKSNAFAEAFSEDAANSKTSEYMALDKDGYMLAQESNVFHQFYYLNSAADRTEKPTKGKSIGNIFGAQYWKNNRHIIPRSIYGGAPAPGNASATNNYEYLRAHPMTDTKVTCVAWGTTWNGNPEAMWGTENGTVLSWWVDIQAAAKDAGKNSSNYNDSQVAAEIQSYKWIDNASGKTYSSTDNVDTVGSAGETFHINTPSEKFKTFFDKGTQATNTFGQLGFINTLENINDIEFADDIWIAVGDQGGTGLNESSFVDPADYCANGVINQNNIELKPNEHWKVIKAYSGTGEGGSWVNVRYWVDLGDGKQSNENSTYHWRAVQITNQRNCNIVQINNVNGMWIATGYQDTNGNDEYDTGEKPVVCWAYDPLVPYGEDSSLGGWSDKVEFYEEGATSEKSGKIDKSLIGGINSCATRS